MPKGISKEIKQEIMQGVKSGTPVLTISEQYRVLTKTVYAWLKKSVEEPVSLRELQKLRKENAALKETIGELTIEKEMIKKRQTADRLIAKKRVTKVQVARDLGVSRQSLYYQSKQEPKDEELRDECTFAVEMHHLTFKLIST